MTEPRIVSAVAAFTGHGDIDPSTIARNERIQQAMISAVAAAQAEGVTDDDAIRSRMVAARDKAVAEN